MPAIVQTGAFGEYEPHLDTPQTFLTPAFSTVLTGTGAPDDANGSDGNIYIDSSTGDLYTKSGGTWTLFVGGGGGTTQVLGGAADPTNTLTVSGRAIYIQEPDVDGMQNLYAKNSTASNNTDWKLVTSFQS